jgi:hypothetical protein
MNMGLFGSSKWIHVKNRHEITDKHATKIYRFVETTVSLGAGYWDNRIA